MKPALLISNDYQVRLNQILDHAWTLFKSRFIGERHPVMTEAPFQHYFANIIASLGELYCTGRDDRFVVDLETRCEEIRGRCKYIDITCSFPRQKVSCAIELKFKTAQQGAQDHGRIDVYSDIEAVELACDRGFTFGKFYMITDSTPYIRKSARGVGTVFCLHDGWQNQPGMLLHCPESKGREHVKVTLRNAYTFEWEKHEEWYFLDLHCASRTC